jgi:carboxypeptidase Taq
MEAKLKELKDILAEVSDLSNAAALLGWDQQTYMPVQAAASRGKQLGTLSRLAHVRFTSPEVGKLLEELAPLVADSDPDSDEARLVKVTTRQFEKQTKVPPEMVVEFAELTTNAHHVWEQAREKNDFAHFQPYLEKIVDLRRRYAALFAPYEHVYDPLLDDYEPGMKTAEVRAIFGELRPAQVSIVQAISERPQVDDSFLYLEYDPQKQWDFGEEVITHFGFDWERARQDKSTHPFTTSFSVDDVRITTRVNPKFFNTALFGTLHEAGHGLYELGIAHSLERTPLSAGASLAVHESQSRMWENLVGRSLPFWQHFYPRLQAYFPEQLGNVDVLTFYKGINKVEPSLIRVEADEATYNLHIMLRLELEIALMEGSLEVVGLPEAWNERFEDYLGIVPPNDTEGVLQDVHWSSGLFGYFSTYALGNLISLQLWEKINQDIPNLEAQIREGEFKALLDWLVANVHRHGAKFEPQELVKRITGSKIEPGPYVDYLEKKFGEIYGL